MKKALCFLACHIVFLFFLLQSCSDSSTGSQALTKLTIVDVWFEGETDYDEDGYPSDMNFIFELDVNKAEVGVIVKLGIRETDPVSDDDYSLCFTSGKLVVEGGSENNIWYIPISEIDFTGKQGRYDFLLQVFPENNINEVATEAGPSTDPDLSGCLLESSSEDYLSEWISYIDDDVCETYHTYYPRWPIGSYFTTLAERFTLPEGATNVTVRRVSVNLPSIYAEQTSLSISVYDELNALPGDLLHSELFEEITQTGWNEFVYDYMLGSANTFYLGLPTSIHHAIGIDDNSMEINGFYHKYASSNPPQDFWAASDVNYGIKVFVEYALP